MCKPCTFLNNVASEDTHGGRLLSTWTVSQHAPDSPAEPPRVWPRSPALEGLRESESQVLCADCRPGSPSVSVPRICAVTLKGSHGSSHFLYAKCKSLSHVRLFATPQTIQSMEFSKPEYWMETFPFPGDLPHSGIELGSPAFRRIVYHLSYQGPWRGWGKHQEERGE